MASKSGFEGFKKLNITSLRKIADLSPHAGKTLLAEELGIPPYIDPKDMQKAPFISYIYDSLMFAVEKGFPWEHISLVVKVAHDYLKKILVDRHRVSDAIIDFKEQAKTLEPLSDRHKKQFTDHIFDTVLCHYNLYKYVFSHLRDVVHPEVKKEVTIPEHPMPLKKGKSVNVWEYEEKLNAINEREKTEKEQRLQRSREDDLTETKTLEGLDEVPIPYSKMTLSELLKDVLKGYAVTKDKELNAKVIETAKDLEYKLEKTSLPRPAALGSPPRYKPKSPIVTGTPNTNNNLKTDKPKGSAKSRSGRASAASSVSRK